MPYQDSYIAKIRAKVGHDFELVTATTDTVIENQKGELLMVFNRDFNAWAFPGGYVEPEMSWQENSARESLEEGGIVADPQQLQLIGTVSGRHYVAHYPNGDRTKLYTTIYLLTAWDDELSQIDDTEIDAKRWMSPKTIAHTPLTFSGDAVFRVYQQYKATGQAQTLTVDSILQRFLDAQNGEIIGVNSYQDALQELTNGQKQTHWMWFVLPQLKGLGSSARAMYYGIDGEQEANDYLADDTLRERLETIVTTTLNLPDSDPVALFGEVDAQKFQASLTLFGKVADNSELYQRALVKYFNGRLHEPTLALLK